MIHLVDNNNDDRDGCHDDNDVSNNENTRSSGKQRKFDDMEIVDNGDDDGKGMVILMMVQDLMMNIKIAKTIITSMITDLTQGNIGTCA